MLTDRTSQNISRETKLRGSKYDLPTSVTFFAAGLGLGVILGLFMHSFPDNSGKETFPREEVYRASAAVRE
jgi:hypothetical protein